MRRRFLLLNNDVSRNHDSRWHLLQTLVTWASSCDVRLTDTKYWLIISSVLLKVWYTVPTKVNNLENRINWAEETYVPFMSFKQLWYVGCCHPVVPLQKSIPVQWKWWFVQLECGRVLLTLWAHLFKEISKGTWRPSMYWSLIWYQSRE